MKLPPYGKILKAYQEEKVHLERPIYIFVGSNAKQEAYKQKIFGTLCTYLPENEDFTQFDWPVFQQKIVVEESGKAALILLKKLCIYLLDFKPLIIYLNPTSHPGQVGEIIYALGD